MDKEIIKSLIDEFKESKLTKLKLKCEAFELELEQTSENSVGVQVPVAMPQVTIAQTKMEKEPVKEKQPKLSINAPMVGTFYAAASPDAEPFVKIGSRVKKGDIICVLEAMKLMNEVEADKDGEIIDILVANEEMVEFGQALFLIQ